MEFKTQVDKAIYRSGHYFDLERWCSYFAQIETVVDIKPDNVLEIGVGDKTFSSYLKHNTDIDYKSLDFATDLSPDILASVLDMPLPDNSFDTVVAFEVLEHLPFEEFRPALAEIARVARRHVIISLPHFGPAFRLFIKVPLRKPLRLCIKLPFPRKHIFNGQHHWEIGKKGYSPKHVRSVLSEYFTIEKEFLLFENPYHRFFVLTKNAK